jgi:phosphoribosyl 1,2-cyclic phosphodiesterase
VATAKTRLLVDAGFGRKATFARLAAAGEHAHAFSALVISHEHYDHICGLRSLALHLRVPIYITRATREAVRWDPRLNSFEHFVPGEKFVVGDIEITPFAIPHDAADPVAFTFEAEGVKIGLVTDLGYVPQVVKQRVRGCHCLIFESNHDLDMLKVGPYPWFLKQRLMSRQGHLSNRTTADFLGADYDGQARVLILAHLSETNNHPEIARLSALQALGSRSSAEAPELHLASQSAPTPIFQF